MEQPGAAKMRKPPIGANISGLFTGMKMIFSFYQYLIEQSPPDLIGRAQFLLEFKNSAHKVQNAE